MPSPALEIKRLSELPPALIARGFQPPHPRFVRDAAISGFFPAFRIGSWWFWRATDLDVIYEKLSTMELPLTRARRVRKVAGQPTATERRSAESVAAA
jgi:hypothetical protein